MSFILGARIPEVPSVVKARRQAHPQDKAIPDGHVFIQPWPARRINEATRSSRSAAPPRSSTPH